MSSPADEIIFFQMGKYVNDIFWNSATKYEIVALTSY